MATAKLDGRLVSLINGHYENETSLWNLEAGYFCNFRNFLNHKTSHCSDEEKSGSYDGRFTSENNFDQPKRQSFCFSATNKKI